MFFKIQVINNELKYNKQDISEEFCYKKITDNEKNHKCLLFYKEKINENYKGICNCPFGYTCIFDDNSIYSSLIIEEMSNLKLIKGHNKFLSEKMNRGYKTVNLKSVIDYIMIDKIVQLKSDAFHDIKNSNYFIYDLIDDIKEEDEEFGKLKHYIKEYFSILKVHNIKIINITQKILCSESFDEKLEYQQQKNDVYDQTIDLLYKVLRDILCQENKLHDKKTLFDFFHLIKYRIIYLKRFLNIKNVEEGNLIKININLVDEINKLINMMKHFASNKNININFIYEKSDKYNLLAFDSTSLVLFLILENAIKYAVVNSQIFIELSVDIHNNSFLIKFSNESENISKEKIVELINKGIQGDNAKKGSGIGLYMANEILKNKMGKLEISFNRDKNIFSCSIILKDLSKLNSDYV